ncbi:hypothetical protein FRX31_010721, partial [Thalictrum thalictroides]
MSLFKVLYDSSCSSSNLQFLSNGEDFRKKKIMLVVAHPDDEAMFFSPTILHLVSKGHTVHILCLSTDLFYGDELVVNTRSKKVKPLARNKLSTQ